MLERAKRGSCGHSCTVLPLHRQIFLVASSVLYCADIFTDIYVAIDTLVRGDDPDVGVLMLFFVVVPLIYGNYITQSNRFGRIRYINPELNAFTIDKERIKGRPFLRTLAPYRWDSAVHVGFNILCLLQMGILIDVMEMLMHKVQEIPNIGQQYSHYCYIRRLEVMLENCPQLILQVCALIKDEDWLTRTLGTASTSLDTDGGITVNDTIRIVSLVFTIIALPLALCADEEAGRYCSRVSFDLVMEVEVCGLIPVNLQLTVLYLGFLLIIVSRITLIALLYVFCLMRDLTLKPAENFPNMVTPLCVEAHHLVIFVIYLINQRLTETNKSLIIIEKLQRLNMFVSFLFFSFSEVFLILLQFPQRYRRAIRARSKELDKGDERFKSFYFLYIFNLLEFIAFTVVLSKSDIFGSTKDSPTSTRIEQARKIQRVLTHDRMLRGAYSSIACYLLAAVFFISYHSPWLHPDRLKKRASYKSADVTIYGKTPYCARTDTDKCKVPKLPKMSGCVMSSAVQEQGLLDSSIEIREVGDAAV
ncbi:hypothetical protein ACHWQZ_G011028 [Mnemiopsis leidyi]